MEKIKSNSVENKMEEKQEINSLDTPINTVSNSKNRIRKACSELFLGEMKKYTRSQIIAINALVCALILLFAIFPLQIGVLQLAVLQIIAILICTELLGLLNGMLSGLFFGFVSLITHLLRPGVLSPIFIQNPLVTFLPRILIAVGVYFTVKMLEYAFSKIHYKSEKASKITPKFLDTLKYAIGAFMGVLINTVGVLGFIFACYGNSTISTGIAITPAFIWGIVVGNSFLEAGVCTVLTPAIVIAVKKTLSLTMRKKKQ